MGFLDRLRSNPPNTSGKPKAPPGQAPSGRGHSHGFIRPDEFNANLTGAAGQRVFDRMWRSDGTVRKTWSMAIAPIVAATWKVNPYGGDDATDDDRKAAEFQEWMLNEHMWPKLPGHVSQALRVLRAGFVPFEQVWESAEWEGRTVLAVKGLGLRWPRTIFKWEQDGDELTRILQYPMTGTPIWHEIRDLVYYRLGDEGDNWEGESPLRPAYKHWKMKEQLEIVDAIGHERFAVGTPVGWSGVSPSPEQEAALEDFLANLRSNEAGYAMFPGPRQGNVTDGTGIEVDILTPSTGGTSGRDLLGSLKHHKDEMAASMLEEFMRLGQGGTGARALGDTQQEPFMDLVSAIAQSVIADPLNTQLVRRAHALNFGNERFPVLAPSLLDETSLTELAQFVGDLVTSGAITADPEMEAFLRTRARLPPIDPLVAEQKAKQREAATEAAVNPPDPAVKPGAPAPKPGDKPAAKKMQLARAQRDLRPWEELMHLDRVEGAIDGARDRMTQGAGPHAHALAVELAAQAARGKTPRASAQQRADLQDAIHSQLRGLYATGRMTVRDELDAQRPVPHGFPYTLAKGDGDNLAARAAHAAKQVLQRITAALGRLTLEPRTVGHATFQAAAESAATAGLRAEAQLHAAAALNAGRGDEADAQADQIAGSRYTSILDGNRCDPCARADDDVLRPLTDPVRLARKPPNHDCQGGGRCRCIEFMQLTDEGPANA